MPRKNSEPNYPTPIRHLLLYWGDKLAGYLKLNESSAQTDIHDGDSLEIERIYVTKAFQGQGWDII